MWEFFRVGKNSGREAPAYMRGENVRGAMRPDCGSFEIFRAEREICGVEENLWGAKRPNCGNCKMWEDICRA